MGIDTRLREEQRIAALDRRIEGRWALIQRLFDEIDELVDERDGLGRRRPGMLARLFPRRRAPAAGEAAFLAVAREHRAERRSRAAPDDEPVDLPRLRG